jgi:hypothetical protein
LGNLFRVGNIKPMALPLVGAGMIGLSYYFERKLNVEENNGIALFNQPFRTPKDSIH